MRFGRCKLPGGEVSYGYWEGETFCALTGDPWDSKAKKNGGYSAGEVKILAPVEPSKFVCLGINYRDHAGEMGHTLPEEPVMFIKPATALIGPGEKIIYPAMSRRVDFEAELAVVIGKTARQVKEEDAFDYIFGYTCFNDVTARDLQKKDGQWTRAKSFDTFAPLGPWVETEVNPSALNIQARLNGEIKQNSSTAGLIFSVPYLVSFISRVMTLHPGDVIATGTPAGVGPMQRGDRIEIIIENIGTLTNFVI